MTESTTTRQRVRKDPERADKIARGALAVIAKQGIEGLTHRAVAAEAGVPLGSTTYHFATLDDILIAATHTAITANAERLAAWADARGENPDIVAALTDLLMEQAEEHESRTVVEFELYLAALRCPSLETLSLAWSEVLTDVLHRWVDRETADTLSALHDGLLMRVLVSGHRLDRALVARLFHRVVDRHVA